jgi:glycosyltransferase involved in cell wall biosynthesis
MKACWLIYLEENNGAMTKSIKSISVFFPFYNEESNVTRMCDVALEVVPKITDDYEIILVNDGSVDGTRDAIDALVNKHDHVIGVHHETNGGYGAALQSGFKRASKAWIFYTDGDGQFDLNELPSLIDLTASYDIITCYRQNRQEGFMRKCNAYFWGKLVSFVFKLRIKDIDCAFKLYRREIFDEIKMESTGALIDTEILARAQRAGYTMIQRGVTHHPRISGESSGANISVIIKAFKELFVLRKKILSNN